MKPTSKLLTLSVILFLILGAFTGLVQVNVAYATDYSLTVDSTPLAVSYTINSTSYSGYSVTAATGNPIDVQAAGNTVIAAGGGTVYVPSGDWRFDETAPGAVNFDLETLPSGGWFNLIGLGGNTTTTTNTGQTITCPATILRSTTSNPSSGSILAISIVGSKWTTSNNNFVKSTNRHVRISGITILGTVASDTGNNNNGISMSYVDGFLIDHVTVDSHCGSNIGLAGSKGVVSHCQILQTYHLAIGGVWGYGMIVSGNSGLWASNFGTPTWINNLTDIIGKYDWQGINISYSNPQVLWYGYSYGGNYSNPTNYTTSISFSAGPNYIEDSFFSYDRHAIASNGYGYYVARYNVFNNSLIGMPSPYLDVHGANFPSGRGYEAYGNIFKNNPIYGIDFRGGGGVVYNNTFVGPCQQAIMIANDGYVSTIADPQLSQDIWIWNNTYTNISTKIVIWPSEGVTVSDFYSDVPAINIDTGLQVAGTPTAIPPPRPGYASFAYPSPLTQMTSGTTNSTLVLPAATYLVTVPSTVSSGGLNYTFSHWQDASTNTTITVVLSTNTTLTATFLEQGGLSVTLGSPASGSSIGNYTGIFTYTPMSTAADVLKNASLWTNTGGTWHDTADNASTVQKSVLNNITYTFASVGTYLWNIRLCNNSGSYVFAPANFTITILNGIGITLNSPGNGTFASHLLSVNFVYTPVSYGASIVNASLYLNISGTWQNVMNTTSVVNASQNTFTYPLALGNYTFNVKVYNSTTGVFASSNNSFSLVQNWQLSFNWTDWNGTPVTSGLTWQLYNASQGLTYTPGAYALLNGTYTLKTYYGSTLINTTSLPISTYGNTTIPIHLNVLPQTGGLIAVNGTITNMTIVSQTSDAMDFILNGTSGPYNITISSTKKPVYILKDNVTLTEGANWTYDSINDLINIITPTLSVWHIAFTGSVPPPPFSFVLVIFVTSNGQNVTGASVLVSGSSPVTTVNGAASFTLPGGTYTVSASYQGVSKNQTLTLSTNQQVIFDVTGALPTPNWELYASAIVVIAAIVAVAIVGIVVKRRKP